MFLLRNIGSVRVIRNIKKTKAENCHERAKYLQVTVEMTYPRDSSRRGRDRMVVGFTTTYAISAYHH